MEPTLNTGAPSPADPALVESLAVANRILYDQGVVDGFGHVSVRHDRSPAHFLLARNMAPALVTPADILTFDLDGQALDAGDRRVYLERFIHAEIYRARTDVVAVVHSHSPSVSPFAATRTPLRPIYHMSGFLGAGSALFEIRDVAGYGLAVDIVGTGRPSNRKVAIRADIDALPIEEESGEQREHDARDAAEGLLQSHPQSAFVRGDHAREQRRDARERERRA